MKEYQSLSHTRWDCKYHVVGSVLILLGYNFEALLLDSRVVEFEDVVY